MFEFSIKFLPNSSSISRIQTNLIASIRAKIFGRCFSATLSSRTAQKFAIGLSLELFPGCFKKVILLIQKCLLRSLSYAISWGSILDKDCVVIHQHVQLYFLFQLGQLLLAIQRGFWL